jgi:hypothetical protein
MFAPAGIVLVGMTAITPEICERDVEPARKEAGIRGGRSNLTRPVRHIKYFRSAEDRS